MLKRLLLKAKISTIKPDAILCDDGVDMWESKLEDALREFTNLKEILKKGFKFRVDETREKYILIIHKNTCSITFTSTKAEGYENLFNQAEDWAETMLEELNRGNVVSGNDTIDC
jgi:dihydropteroate synthase